MVMVRQRHCVPRTMTLAVTDGKMPILLDGVVRPEPLTLAWRFPCIFPIVSHPLNCG